MNFSLGFLLHCACPDLFFSRQDYHISKCSSCFWTNPKEHLGFDEYRMHNAKTVQKHWCLVFVAYSFLHLDCLSASLKQSRLPIKSIGEACRQQAQSLIETLILYASRQLEQGQPAQDLFSYLFAKQQSFATA
jgi:hypothetical protein